MQRQYPRPGMLEERSRGSLPQDHRPKITFEKNTLGCKHRRVSLKSPGLPRSWSSEAGCEWALGSPGPTALPPPLPSCSSLLMWLRGQSLTHQLSGFLSKVKAEIQGTAGWKACLVSWGELGRLTGSCRQITLQPDKWVTFVLGPRADLNLTLLGKDVPQAWQGVWLGACM